ncbi:hypothetical protein ACLOAU_23905 [Niabella sp. CJ426]|uniref:hypothetical protein n=1 Tax=Niabella sp. CJ426 TaxID=3393740 RepID=UPI003D0516F2
MKKTITTAGTILILAFVVLTLSSYTNNTTEIIYTPKAITVKTGKLQQGFTSHFNYKQYLFLTPPPSPVYYSLSFENINSAPYYSMADVVIRFYSDPDLLIPYSASNLAVTLNEQKQGNLCGCQLSQTDHNFICNGYEVTLLSSAPLWQSIHGSGEVDEYSYTYQITNL